MKKRSSNLPDPQKIKQGTEESPESYRHLQQLIAEMPGGFALHEIICDAHGKPIDYRFLQMNASFERLTGLVAGKIIGRTALEVFPDLEPLWIETFGRVALTGQTERLENFSPAPGKTFSVVAYCPQPGQFAVLFEALTMPKQADDKLIASEEKYHSLFYVMTEGVAINELVMDANGNVVDYIIREVNPAFEINTPFKAADVLGKRATEIYQMSPEFITSWWQQHVDMGSTAYTELYNEPTRRWHAITTTQPANGRFYTIFSDITERKRSLQAIKESNQSLSLALDASKAGTYDWDIANNTFVWSPEFLKVFGMSADTVAGFEAWRKAVHPQDVEAAGARIQESIDKHTDLINDYRIILPTGEVRHIRATGKTYYDGDRPLRMAGLCMDVTPLVQAEQKFFQSAGNMQAILDSNLDAVFLIDPDGTIVAANQALASRFGRTRDDLIGSNTYDLVDKKLAAQRRKYMDKVISTGEPTRLEDERDGLTIESSIYPVLDENGKVVRLAIYSRDISDQKKATRSLAESEERFRVMIENAPLGYQSLDIDGNFIHVNPVWLEILGYERDEVVGHWFGDFLVPEYRDAFRERFPLFIAAGQIHSEFEMVHKNGSKLFVAFEGRIGYDLAGNFKQTHCILQDITEKRRHEEQVRRSEMELKKAQSYAHVGSWVWDIKGGNLEWSDEMFNIFGISKENFNGKLEDVVASSIHPDDRQMVEDSNRSVTNESKPIPLEYRIVLPDGSQRVVWAEAGELEMDTEGKPALLRGIVMDITERKQAEKLLRESEERMRISTELANIAVWEFNYLTNSMSRSKNHDSLYGLEWQEVWKYETFLEATHPDDREYSNQIIQHSAAVGGPDQYEFDFRVVYPDGSIHWLSVIGHVFERDLTGKGITVRGSLIDITERKQAEEALRVSEEKFRTIIDVSPVPFALNDDDLNITFLNPAFIRTFGYTLQDIPVLENWWQLAYPDPEYRQWVATTWQEHLDKAKLTGDPFESMEVKVRCKKGDSRIVVVSETSLVGSFAGTHLVIFHDITERKQAEEAVEIERNFARLIMNSMGQGLTVTDEHSCFEYVNPAYAHMTGYNPQDLLGKTPADLTIQGSLPILKEAASKRNLGETSTYEIDLKHRDGHPVPVMITGVPRRDGERINGTIAFITDLTERKRAEEALQESERRYRDRATELETIMDIAPVALWMAQDPDCHVLVGNRAANELHRIQPDQNPTLTPAIGQILKPERLKLLHNGVEITPNELPLQVCASKGIEIRDFESQIVFEDGRVVHEIGNAKPLFDEKGKPRGAVGAFMNVTGMKQVEEELRRRVEELDALQRTVFDITAAQTLPGLLQSIVERACQLVGAPGGALYLADPVKQEVRCEISYKTPGNYVGVVLKYGEGVAGRVAQTGQPFSIGNYKTWVGRAQSYELDRPFSTVLGVPLIWGGQVYGVIDVLHYAEGKTFSQADMDLLNIFAGHAAIAIENSRLLEASQAGEAQVRILSARLAEAEENERRRIARELHDQVGQSLSALSINMNIMHSQVPEYLPGFKRRLVDSLMLIDQTTDHIRHLMSELRPAVLDDYGLKAALDWAVGAIAKRSNLKLQVEGECKRFPPRVEIALFRIGQEALGNIVRHAHARNVRVLLSQEGPEMTMTISDDGVGFDPGRVEATERFGWGLRLMAERAESIGATLQVGSTIGKGTSITVRYNDDNPAGG